MLKTVGLHVQDKKEYASRSSPSRTRPSSIPRAQPENSEQKRDPEIHQSKQGNLWHFGTKAHVGADSTTKMIHSALVTAAHIVGATVLPELLHGEKTRVWGEQGYRGQSEVIHESAPVAQD